MSYAIILIQCDEEKTVQGGIADKSIAERLANDLQNDASDGQRYEVREETQ